MSRRRLTEAALAGFGIALILAALAAGQGWWDRHFMPVFAVERSTMVAAEQVLRGLIALAGAALSLVLRRPIAAVLSRSTIGGALRILLAVVLALGAGELILRAHPPHPHDADPLEQEPRRQADPWLGWDFVPARSVTAEEAGRRVSYSFDAAGHRVPAPGTVIDVERPTLLFTGESIIAGFGLASEETISVRVGALLGIQSVNLAVSDYSNDQSYLRLAVELPRFRKPVAVVTLFMPSLFDRNLLDNRPHLAAGLVWQPADWHWRLAALLRWLIPYRSNAAVEQGITRTRDSLCALIDLARARGALPLIVVPQFGPESATEEMLRRRILDETELPYVHVKLDPSWHLPGDLHPDPRAAQAIAIAVAGRLRGRYADGKPPGGRTADHMAPQNSERHSWSGGHGAPLAHCPPADRSRHVAFVHGWPLLEDGLLSGRSVITNTHRVGESVMRSSTDSAHGILSRTATIRTRLDQACEGRNLDERDVRNDTA